MEEVLQPSAGTEDERIGVDRSGDEDSLWDARGNLLVYIYRKVILRSIGFQICKVPPFSLLFS